MAPSKHCQKAWYKKPAESSTLLSLPSQSLACHAVPGAEREFEALGELISDENGCSLVALVGVLFIHCSVMLLRILAAFNNSDDHATKLLHSIARIMNVSHRLRDVSIRSEILL